MNCDTATKPVEHAEQIQSTVTVGILMDGKYSEQNNPWLKFNRQGTSIQIVVPYAAMKHRHLEALSAINNSSTKLSKFETADRALTAAQRNTINKSNESGGPRHREADWPAAWHRSEIQQGENRMAEQLPSQCQLQHTGIRLRTIVWTPLFGRHVCDRCEWV